MTTNEILSHVDHTLLATTATWSQIKELVDQAAENGMATVCIPPCYVARAHSYNPQIKICTVVGFPNGYNNTAAKVAETQQAIDDGASEIDMVINLCALKSGDIYIVRNEIAEIKKVCGSIPLKVIVETCLLDDEEKRLMCRVCAEAHADYIKTSTGFSKSGADRLSIIIMNEEIQNKKLNLKIKAAGGIRSLEDMEWYLSHGCERIGTSSALKLISQN